VTQVAPVFSRPSPEPVKIYGPEENPLDIDWITWALGLLAFIAVGGLIPFWLWVYLSYNPPGK